MYNPEPLVVIEDSPSQVPPTPGSDGAFLRAEGE